MERNVPKLRFKGFNDEWEEKKLGSMGKALIGLTYSPDNISDKENGLLVLRSSNIKDGHLNYNDNVYVNMPVKDDIRVRKNDILLCSRNGSKALIGKSALIDSDINATFGAFMTVIRANNGKFINQLINTREFFRQINMNLGATINQITSSNLNNFKFKVPSHQEQERIANFLTKVDKIIEKQEEKVKNLENYKKGMMQKIFSQEIRFKDENGNEYPEWEDKRIGDIFIEINEKTSIKNQYEVLSSTSTGLFKQSEYFNREIASEDNTGYKILRKKQIVLSPQNLWLGNINYNNKYETGIVSPSYKIFNVVENILPQFIAYIIKLDRMLYEYKQASEQGASVVRRNLNMDLFNDIVIKIPCYREQSRITAYLNNIDVILEKEKNKLEELKQWKKGLLQQMFV